MHVYILACQLIYALCVRPLRVSCPFSFKKFVSLFSAHWCSVLVKVFAKEMLFSLIKSARRLLRVGGLWQAESLLDCSKALLFFCHVSVRYASPVGQVGDSMLRRKCLYLMNGRFSVGGWSHLQ